MASTPLLEAASISCTSSEVPWAISVHDVHIPHGSPSAGAAQLSALARIRAEDVLPVPRGPAEQIGVRDPALAHGVPQGPDHVVLAPELLESTRSEAPVQAIRRGRRPWGSSLPVRRDNDAGARRGGQVGYGTRPYPLRAAAFRP